MSKFKDVMYPIICDQLVSAAFNVCVFEMKRIIYAFVQRVNLVRQLCANNINHVSDIVIILQLLCLYICLHVCIAVLSCKHTAEVRKCMCLM